MKKVQTNFIHSSQRFSKVSSAFYSILKSRSLETHFKHLRFTTFHLKSVNI